MSEPTPPTSPSDLEGPPIQSHGHAEEHTHLHSPYCYLANYPDMRYNSLASLWAQPCYNASMGIPPQWYYPNQPVLSHHMTIPLYDPRAFVQNVDIPMHPAPPPLEDPLAQQPFLSMASSSVATQQTRPQATSVNSENSPRPVVHLKTSSSSTGNSDNSPTPELIKIEPAVSSASSHLTHETPSTSTVQPTEEEEVTILEERPVPSKTSKKTNKKPCKSKGVAKRERKITFKKKIDVITIPPDDSPSTSEITDGNILPTSVVRPSPGKLRALLSKPTADAIEEATEPSLPDQPQTRPGPSQLPQPTSAPQPSSSDGEEWGVVIEELEDPEDGRRFVVGASDLPQICASAHPRLLSGPFHPRTSQNELTSPILILHVDEDTPQVRTNVVEELTIVTDTMSSNYDSRSLTEERRSPPPSPSRPPRPSSPPPPHMPMPTLSRPTPRVFNAPFNTRTSSATHVDPISEPRVLWPHHGSSSLPHLTTGDSTRMQSQLPRNRSHHRDIPSPPPLLDIRTLEPVNGMSHASLPTYMHPGSNHDPEVMRPWQQANPFSGPQSSRDSPPILRQRQQANPFSGTQSSRVSPHIIRPWQQVNPFSGTQSSRDSPHTLRQRQQANPFSGTQSSRDAPTILRQRQQANPLSGSHSSRDSPPILRQRQQANPFSGTQSSRDSPPILRQRQQANPFSRTQSSRVSPPILRRRQQANPFSGPQSSRVSPPVLRQRQQANPFSGPQSSRDSSPILRQRQQANPFSGPQSSRDSPPTLRQRQQANPFSGSQSSRDSPPIMQNRLRMPNIEPPIEVSQAFRNRLMHRPSRTYRRHHRTNDTHP